VTAARLEVAREQILAFRRAVGALDARLPPGATSLRRAAWAGLQDSMPRAAVFSIQARVEETEPSSWEDPSLAQLWGPRYSVYVVPAEDLAVFSLGRLPEAPGPRQRAEDMAARLHATLDGKTMTDRDAAAIAGVNSNAFRYAAPTGTVRIRWEGARAPTLWTVPRPEVDPRDARLELARRYLHVFGPTTAQSFADWADILPGAAIVAFEQLRAELMPVSTPLGDRRILASDEPAIRAASAVAPAPARLLPSGDAYWLLWGRDRELLVPDPDRRPELWTPRVWPGALLVGGEIVGTWRRADANVAIQAWRRLNPAELDAVEAEATGLPLPGLAGRIRVAWTV
jgi:winged helix DNA-binding protein